jgi:hypothetical protein
MFFTYIVAHTEALPKITTTTTNTTINTSTSGATTVAPTISAEPSAAVLPVVAPESPAIIAPTPATEPVSTMTTSTTTSTSTSAAVGKPPGSSTTTVVMLSPEFENRHVNAEKKTKMGKAPKTFHCEFCNEVHESTVERQTGCCTHIWAIGIAVMGFFWGPCLIPYCLDCSKDTVHRCSNCNEIVGYNKQC